ncbi:MAG: ABC transporter permease, partial [Lachnospiraceae bacterium]|nr:ABC transporter permease [Lachnospiraceae bacterium]
TAFLWVDTKLSNVAFAALALWFAGFLYLSILMIGCVLFQQTFTSILFTGGIAAIISLLGMIEPLAKFSPLNLTTQNIDLISGVAAPSDFILPTLTSVIISIMGLLIAIRLFKTKEL